jgi:hypothetical protein
MRLGTAILALAATISLGGCSLKKQPQTAKAVPPPPKPVPPAKPPEPLSIPQTNVELPPPQLIPPDALPPAEPGTTPAPPPTTNRQQNRPPARQGATPAPKPEPATPTAPERPAVTERPPVAEVLSAAEAKRLQDEAHARTNEAHQTIARLSARRRNQQKSIIDRINTFLTQAQEAERRGDMRQASELAGRAAVLARELTP